MKIRLGFVSNSSSEAFICGTWGDCKYSIEETIKILQKMLNFYNDLEEKNLSFETVFETPRMGDKEDEKLLVNGWDVSEWKIKDKMIIYSQDDNSIPFMLFEMISQKFNAERIHLG